MFFETETSIDPYDLLPLSKLYNPETNFPQSITYIYSMETPLPYILNKASREKDYSKVATIGPFSHALSFII